MLIILIGMPGEKSQVLRVKKNVILVNFLSLPHVGAGSEERKELPGYDEIGGNLFKGKEVGWKVS